MTRRIAIYGGSFDPFHLGHLIPTVRAAETFQFDAVHFVPAAQPPHKLEQRLTPVTHRYVMVAMATLPYDRFYTSDMEVFEHEPSYTVDTLRRCRASFADDILYYVMGSDSFSQIATWQGWRELVELAHLVVLHRQHMWGDELRARIPAELLPRLSLVAPFQHVPDPAEQTIYLLDHEPFPISSTDIRERQRLGLPIRELLPHEVYSYIEKYGLYRTGGEAADATG